jgi:hypothetical protein
VTNSSRLSTSCTPASVSPATPSDVNTMLQNWWMVAMVAESNPASASPRRVRRAVRSSGLPASRCRTTWLSPASSSLSNAASARAI